jgi:hypothetical protein
LAQMFSYFCWTISISSMFSLPRFPWLYALHLKQILKSVSNKREQGMFNPGFWTKPSVKENKVCINEQSLEFWANSFDEGNWGCVKIWGKVGPYFRLFSYSMTSWNCYVLKLCACSEVRLIDWANRTWV